MNFTKDLFETKAKNTKGYFQFIQPTKTFSNNDQRFRDQIEISQNII